MDDKTQAMGSAPADFDMQSTRQFDAPPSPPPPGGALHLNVRVGHGLALASARTQTHILTEVTAAPGTGVRLPVNVALVVDRSGSMEGEPLEYVKRACAHVVDLLEPTDILSIVTFEDTVDILMPARYVTDRNLIKQHIARIAPGNTTNLFDGLYAGGSQVASVANGSYATRVLLLTDGEPTAGLRDFASITGQAADLQARGIPVTTLGFGPEYNEELIAAIARRGGGNYHHITRADQIPDVFRQEMETVLGVAARGVRLSLNLPRGCTVREVYGDTPVLGERTAEIALPDIENGVTVSRLWAVEWTPRRAGTYRVAQATLSWMETAAQRPQRVTADAVVDFVLDPSGIEAGMDPEVTRAVTVARATRNLEQTMQGMRTQQFSAADVAASLDRTQNILAQEGQSAAAAEVAEVTRALRRGDNSDAEKTLMGTIFDLDQGKH